MILNELIVKSLYYTTTLSSLSSALPRCSSSSSSRLLGTRLMMTTTTDNRQLTTTVLDPSRDPFATIGGSSSTPPNDDEEYKVLYQQLEDNHKLYTIKYGPTMAFHNHAAAMMTSTYRLGGTSKEISEVIGGSRLPELSGLKTLDEVSEASARADNDDDGDGILTITTDNWKDHLGGFGLYGIGAHTTYPAYVTFFQQQLDQLKQQQPHDGDNILLQTYFPTLVKGCIGDFFHALIELGYYFESYRHPSMLAQGLAWLAASHIELPNPPALPNDNNNKLYSSPLKAMEDISNDSHKFPTFDLLDGSSGYIAAMEDMTADIVGHERILSKYYQLQDFVQQQEEKIEEEEVAQQLDHRMYEIICAAVDSFYYDGANDFYLLHLVTGSRAAWAILNGCKLKQQRNEPSSSLLPMKTRQDLLNTLWRAMILTHVARNRPWSSSSTSYESTSTTSCRPWSEIIQIGKESKNSHIIKVIMNLADFYDKYGDDRFWIAANKVASNRQEGLRLVGTGEGSQIERYKK